MTSCPVVPPSTARRTAVAIAGIFESVLAMVLVPNRLNVIVPLPPPGGWTAQLILPVGYWATAGAYAFFASRMLGGRGARAVRVGIVAHLLLLLATFVPQLGDSTNFTIGPYRQYGRVVCALAIVAAVGWSIATIRRWWSGSDPDAIVEVPMYIPTIALGVIFGRHDPVLAAAALIGGIALGSLASRPGDIVRRVPGALRRWMSSEVLFLIAIASVAFMIRLLYTRQVMTNPRFVETGGDGETYDRLAWLIAQGKGVPEEFTRHYALMMLGYVRFVAAIYRIAGHNYFAVCAIQSVLGAATCVLAYDIAKRIFGTFVARQTAALTAVSFLLIFSAASLGHQAVDVFLTVTLVWLLVRYINQPMPGKWQSILIGVVLAAAITVRETAAFFWAFLAVWLPWALAPRLGWSRALARASIVTVTMFAILTPLLVPLVSTADRRALVRRHLDVLYHGEWVDARTELVSPFGNPTAAAEQIATQPILVARTFFGSVAANFAVQFLEQPFGTFDLVFLLRGSAFYFGLWCYAYAFAFAGLALAVRRAWRGGPSAPAIVLVLGLIVSRTVLHLALASAYQHRAPIEPFLVMLAAYAIAVFLGADTTDAGVLTSPAAADRAS